MAEFELSHLSATEMEDNAYRGLSSGIIDLADSENRQYVTCVMPGTCSMKCNGYNSY